MSTVYDDVRAGVFEHDQEQEGGALSSLDKDQEDAASVSGLEEAEFNASPGDSADNPEPNAAVLGDDEEESARHENDLVPTAAATARKRRRRRLNKDMTREERLWALRRQVEFYFSDGNLAADTFFHQKISQDPEGWLDATLVLGCNRVKKLQISEEGDIEAALVDSELETQWLTATEGQKLQLRRKNGRRLPELRAAGWLTTQIQQRRAASGQATAEVQGEEVPLAPQVSETPKAGDHVLLTAGEAAGQEGQVLSVDESEFTVLVGGADVVVVSRSDLKLQALP